MRNPCRDCPDDDKKEEHYKDEEGRGVLLFLEVRRAYGDDFLKRNWGLIRWPTCLRESKTPALGHVPA